MKISDKIVNEIMLILTA